VGGSAVDERVAAVAAALSPYAWRDLTDRMLARRVVAAMDRHDVVCFLTGLPGTEVGVLDAVEPADIRDERVGALVRTLEGQRWRGWSLTRLCGDVIAALEEWQAERKALESGLRRLLGGH
jgi:hypothetical protein